MSVLPERSSLTPDQDPGGLAASVQVAVSSLLVALGVADVVASKWLLVVQGVVGLGSILWARTKAWAPAEVWLETLNARAAGAAPLPKARKARR